MLDKFEEDLIYEAVDTILYNLKQIPVDDFAYFLVKNDPALAAELLNSIKLTFLDEDMKNDK